MASKLFDDSVDLLRKLISIPSLSKEEQQTAAVIEQFLEDRGVKIRDTLKTHWQLTLLMVSYLV